MEKKNTDVDSVERIHVIRVESIILQTQHDAFVRYTSSHVNTDERTKKKKTF